MVRLDLGLGSGLGLGVIGLGLGIGFNRIYFETTQKRIEKLEHAQVLTKCYNKLRFKPKSANNTVYSQDI